MNSPTPVSLEERLLDCFPSGSYALAALLRLMDIVPTEEVDTAAVECRVQPRLLINPAFVERHAETSEKLLMLVMHELHHVLLGHTTLFPTVTRVENFVCDCIINALISRMFPHEEHLAFLTGYYSDTHYPEVSAPARRGLAGDRRRGSTRARATPETVRARVEAIHRALYSEAGATYREVYEILPGLVATGAVEGIPLLGGHSSDGATEGELERRAPLLFDIVRGIVEQWPQPPDPNPRPLARRRAERNSRRGTEASVEPHAVAPTHPQGIGRRQRRFRAPPRHRLGVNDNAHPEV